MTIEAALETERRINELVGNIDHIATLPEVTARITAVANDPRSTAADLHRVIAHDPALVSRILRLVNSAFYARTTEVTSIERAIVLLGFDTVHHLAIAATVGQLFRGVELCKGYTARDLWTHCIGVAAVARDIARRVCPPMAEEVFLGALLHDVGLLVSLQVCPHKLRRVCELAQADPRSFSMYELDIIGVDHQELGSALAQRWKFPTVCRVGAGHHHHPAMAQDGWQIVAGIIQAADVLCCQGGVGFSLTAAGQLADEAFFMGFVPSTVIDSARERLAEITGPAIAVFG